MTIKTINKNVLLNAELLEDKELRDEISRIEVLSKVKDLITLPNTNLMTTKMVAEFYEVDIKSLRKTIERNRNELEYNGMVYMKFPEIREEISKNDIISLLMIKPKSLGLSPMGSFVFSLRAVLNVGMVLQDSVIASEVRKQLLKG